MFNNLYDNIGSLPNKHSEFFKNFYPTIENYIKINNIKNEEELKNFYEDEKKNIKQQIYQFYNNENSLIRIYANQILLLINKDLEPKHEYIQNILQNLPLNFFYIDIINQDLVKIK